MASKTHTPKTTLADVKAAEENLAAVIEIETAKRPTRKPKAATLTTAEEKALGLPLAPLTADEEALLADAAAAAPRVEEVAQEIAAETKARRTAMPKKAAEPKPEEPSVDLAAALFDGLAAAGVAAEKVAPPTSSHYFKIVVDGKLVAFVNLRKGGALLVEPKLVGGKTPKGFEARPAEKVRQGLGFFATISTEKEIANAVAAVRLAAEAATKTEASS